MDVGAALLDLGGERLSLGEKRRLGLSHSGQFTQLFRVRRRHFGETFPGLLEPLLQFGDGGLFRPDLVAARLRLACELGDGAIQFVRLLSGGGELVLFAQDVRLEAGLVDVDGLDRPVQLDDLEIVLRQELREALLRLGDLGGYVLIRQAIL